MSDTTHGFDKHYAHKNLPNAWSRSSAFTHYQHSPLSRTSFRPADLPVWRDSLAPAGTSYSERSQSEQNSMSCYGSHREFSWDTGLRSARNPHPGNRGREMRYAGEACASSWKAHRPLSIGDRTASSWRSGGSCNHPLATPRSGPSSAASTPRRLHALSEYHRRGMMPRSKADERGRAAEDEQDELDEEEDDRDVEALLNEVVSRARRSSSRRR